MIKIVCNSAPFGCIFRDDIFCSEPLGFCRSQSPITVPNEEKIEIWECFGSASENC